MNAKIMAVLNDCVSASVEERMTFPQVIEKLITVSVERYHIDLCRGHITFYFATGASEVISSGKVLEHPAQHFSASGVQSAVHAIQQGHLGYQAFCQRVLQAGCAGWQVSILGKRVVYYGRTGETHVELFPGKK